MDSIVKTNNQIVPQFFDKGVDKDKIIISLMSILVGATNKSSQPAVCCWSGGLDLMFIATNAANAPAAAVI